MLFLRECNSLIIYSSSRSGNTWHTQYNNDNHLRCERMCFLMPHLIASSWACNNILDYAVLVGVQKRRGEGEKRKVLLGHVYTRLHNYSQVLFAVATKKGAKGEYISSCTTNSQLPIQYFRFISFCFLALGLLLFCFKLLLLFFFFLFFMDLVFVY